MTQHTELIERLYEESQNNPDDDRWKAADALEVATKNAFEAMPPDIPKRMKDAICDRTGWSGSMVSRMYTELRKDFTGEPYKGNEDLDAALAECERLRKDAERYAWLRHGDNDEKVLCNGPVAKDYWYLPRNERLDAAIDTAMKKEGHP